MKARRAVQLETPGEGERQTSEEVLLEVAQACSSTLELEALLQRTVNALPTLVDADRASIWFVQGEELVPAAISATDGWFARQWLQHRLSLAEEPLSREAVQTGRPVIVADAATDPRTNKDAVRLFNDRTILVVPLLHRSDPRRVQGTLFLNHIHRHHHYTSRELELLGTMATMIATAVDHAWLYSQVQGEQRLLQTIIDRLPEAVIVIRGLEEQTLVTNAKANLLFGTAVTSGSSLHNWRPSGRLEQADGRSIQLASLGLADALERGLSSSGKETVLVRDDGARVDLLVNSAPLSDAQGQPAGAVSVFADITPLREFDRARDTFIAVATHELKNPLTSLRACTQLLLRRVDRLPLNSQDRRSLEVINDQAQRLERLIRRLLDASRIQLGRLELKLEPVDLVALTRQVIEGYQAAAVRHRIVLEAPDAGVSGCWDRDALAEVLHNLVENAVRYSPDGGEVRVDIQAVESGVEVRVSDKGPGIASEEQSRIFERFYRSPQQSSPGCLGLGLYICRQIVELHGGRIWVESVEGRGTSFRFVLPTQAAS